MRRSIIGDLFDIQGLKDLAKKKFEGAIPSFVESMKLLYEENVDANRLLKDVAIKVAGEHVKELVDRGELLFFERRRVQLLLMYFKVYLTSVPKLYSCGTSTYVSAAGYLDNYGYYCGGCGGNLN
jgi:hypothetical protein